jgi:hypothetical protein
MLGRHAALNLPLAYLAHAAEFLDRARRLLAERIVERRVIDPAEVWLARQMAIEDARRVRLRTYARRRAWPLVCHCGRHRKVVDWTWRGLNLVDTWCHATWRSTGPVDGALPACCVAADEAEESAVDLDADMAAG